MKKDLEIISFLRKLDCTDYKNLDSKSKESKFVERILNRIIAFCEYSHIDNLKEITLSNDIYNLVKKYSLNVPKQDNLIYIGFEVKIKNSSELTNNQIILSDDEVEEEINIIYKK